ncbi:MAG: hypothetical protein KDB90_10845 [Planctomycetes bacterium]|nr:hypothetical protein [Planctomycetota bacterium]
MGVVVTGIGVVSALGANPAAFRRALVDGTSACTMHDFVRFDGSVVRAPAYLAVPAEPEGLIEPRKLRRMFRLARMSAVAARQALKHAELDPAAMDSSRLGICFGTSFGAMEPTQKFMDSWIENGEASASPLQFMNSVHGILASQIALDINATGVNLTTAQRDICFEAALDTAVGLLETRRADVLLVGGADEVTAMLHEFGSHTGQLVLDEVPGLDPWGSRRGVVPGDGAAVFVLERDDSPRRALARVTGTRIGRCDHSGPNVAAEVLSADGTKPDLVTSNRDGGSRIGKLNNAQDRALGVDSVSHRGNFGTWPAAGAMQFAANVLMLSNGEYYEPLANGRPSGRRGAAPGTILHNAPSISGSHAAYVLTA